MQRIRIVILGSIGVTVIISLAVAVYLSIAIDNRKQMAIDLLTKPDGSLNYNNLEILLNEKYMSSSGFEGVVDFVKNYGGVCTEHVCRLPVAGTFCVIENAIITLQTTEHSKYLNVERRLDGC